MMPIAYRGLRHLRNECLRIAQQQAHYGAGAIELLFQQLRLQSKTVSRALNHSPARRGFTAHEQRYAEYAFIADHGDFGRCAILQYIEQRYDGGGREIYMFQLSARLAQGLAERHL